jgi:hypothetical protein
MATSLNGAVADLLDYYYSDRAEDGDSLDWQTLDDRVAALRQAALASWASSSSLPNRGAVPNLPDGVTVTPSPAHVLADASALDRIVDVMRGEWSGELLNDVYDIIRLTGRDW